MDKLSLAIALAALVAATPPILAAAGGLDRGTADAGPAADGGACPDAGRRDPDSDLLDHLDELENLELLENLDLFDDEADGKKR